MERVGDFLMESGIKFHIFDSNVLSASIREKTFLGHDELYNCSRNIVRAEIFSVRRL